MASQISSRRSRSSLIIARLLVILARGCVGVGPSRLQRQPHGQAARLLRSATPPSRTSFDLVPSLPTSRRHSLVANLLWPLIQTDERFAHHTWRRFAESSRAVR